MTTASRRAPARARRFTVLSTFRYARRVYEVGAVFAPSASVPRLRLDRLWREGCIATLDGQKCPTPKNPAVAVGKQRKPSLQRRKAIDSVARAHGVDVPLES